MNMIKDQLSWEEFLKKSLKNKKINKVEPFNRLIAHSKNLFVISGYGAFTQGYLIIITKDYLPSFGLIEDDQIEELNFMIKICKKSIQEEYKKKTVIFEHGMCACVGGLDRAHLHMMSVDKRSNNDTLKISINKSLFMRKAGIKSITFNGHKLQNIHDINQLYDEALKDNRTYNIDGKLLKINDKEVFIPHRIATSKMLTYLFLIESSNLLIRALVIKGTLNKSWINNLLLAVKSLFFVK